MYVRESRGSSAIPVASFDNSAALDALARMNREELSEKLSHPCPKAQAQKSQSPPQQTAENVLSEEIAETQETKESSCGIKRFIDSLGKDDILLILLIILFISDKDTSNDFMIPILLAVLLLS